MPWKNTNDRMNFSAQHRKAIPMHNKTIHSHLRRISSVQNPIHSTLSLRIHVFSPMCAHHHLSACIFLRTSTSCFCPFPDFSSSSSLPIKIKDINNLSFLSKDLFLSAWLVCVCVYCLLSLSFFFSFAKKTKTWNLISLFIPMFVCCLSLSSRFDEDQSIG